MKQPQPKVVWVGRTGRQTRFFSTANLHMSKIDFMKAILLKANWLVFGILGFVAGTTTLYSQDRYAQDRAIIQQNTANTASAKYNFVPRDPWRAIDGATNYVKKDGVEFCGKIMDVTKDGVRIEGEFGELFGTGYFPGVYDYEDFFVANFPFDVVNDQVIPGKPTFDGLAFRNLYIFPP